MPIFTHTFLRKALMAVILTVGLSTAASAQKVALSTNFVDWANYGTLNLDAGMSVSRHFTLFAGCKFNPWEFQTKSGMPVMNIQTTAYLGTRYWPFYTYTGWWFGARARFTDYAQTGVLRPKYFLGTSIGAGLSAGYSWRLTKHLNLDLGAGFWGGRHLKYEQYRTISNMILEDKGPRNFISVDDISLALVYVF